MASPPTSSRSTAAPIRTALPATGFLGAIVGGVLAGVIAHWIAGWRVPAWARGLMPVLVIPLFTSIIAGFIMIVVLGKPIDWLMTELNRGLNNMSGSSAILLGIILGLMMAFDMGGPLNKVAYSLRHRRRRRGRAGQPTAPLKIMAAVMLAGMVPPIALALATVRPTQALHRRRTGERQGRLAARRVVHHRGGHPVRRRRPAAGDPVASCSEAP